MTNCDTRCKGRQTGGRVCAWWRKVDAILNVVVMKASEVRPE